LDDGLRDHRDFKKIFQIKDTAELDIVQCADVRVTTHRTWVRIIGVGFDLQHWKPDDRLPSHPNKVPYESVEALWVREIVDPWTQRLFPGMDLFAKSGGGLLSGVKSNDLETEEICTLFGYAEASDDPKNSKNFKNGTAFVATTLREVVVYRYPRVIHVFNVVEHGRRFYRTLIFSSDSFLSPHDLPVANVHIGDRFYQVRAAD